MISTFVPVRHSPLRVFRCHVRIGGDNRYLIELLTGNAPVRRCECVCAFSEPLVYLKSAYVNAYACMQIQIHTDLCKHTLLHEHKRAHSNC